ncbi:MAG: HesA/MoeB/ThiF family protein [Oscillospiraceae bacterium]|nr:HesA/MoeB/ThiF family protein [Oscillospiraceae bacterium]
MGRYERNHPAISENEQEKLQKSRVFVAGCGGLGGYILEFLVRIGVGHITACDGDTFAPSNLNRQLLSAVPLLGVSKAKTAAMRAADVNPEVEVSARECFITEENAAELISGHDLVIDALDNGNARHILAKEAKKQGIPMVSGGISGWAGRVFVLMPEDEIPDYLWLGPAGTMRGNLGFTAACCASVQAAEAVKVLIGRGEILHGRMLEFDLKTSEFEDIPLDLTK